MAAIASATLSLPAPKEATAVGEAIALRNDI